MTTERITNGIYASEQLTPKCEQGAVTATRWSDGKYTIAISNCGKVAACTMTPAEARKLSHFLSVLLLSRVTSSSQTDTLAGSNVTPTREGC
jgi:hypothetical protein